MFFFFFDMDNKDKVKVFLESLLKTNKTYDYFVCWNNVFLQEFDIELNAINSLIKIKEDDTKHISEANKLEIVIGIIVVILIVLFVRRMMKRKKLEKNFE